MEINMKEIIKCFLILIAILGILGIFIGGYAVGIKEIDTAVEKERQKNSSLMIEALHKNKSCIEEMKKADVALERANQAMTECIEMMKFINN